VELEYDYMDEQYAYLMDLIRTAELPPLKPKCDKGEQKWPDAREKFKQ
jgi:hypothetical protein